MGLKEYKAKRRFDETPEPEGTPSRDKGPLRFVVQKHEASHLHYDFRLEMEGVMKSWAIPKGPSLNPEDKRLAMMTEDHPLDYRAFEGTIPKGNYGAGTVMVWDEGTYHTDSQASRKENEAALLKGLKAGKIVFTLEGQKLKGEFALVKLRNSPRYPQENAWLLIKHADAEASNRDIREDDRSVVSGRGMEEIRVGKTAISKAKNNTGVSKPKKKDPMPHRVEPMLATLVKDAFDSSEWLYEIKWDGYRAVAEINGSKTAFYSRKFNSYHAKFPLLYQELKKPDRSMILDGEVVALNAEGAPDFQLLQNYEINQDALYYCVFDLLYLDGLDLRNRPLLERKTLLENILEELGSERIRYTDHVLEQGTAFFRAVEAQGMEGMIAKEIQSRYLSGKRSEAWLKIKTHKRQEFVIGGYTEPKGSREAIGSLLLGVYENDGLHFTGKTGTGMDIRELKRLKAKLEPLEIAECPFVNKQCNRMSAHWVKPQLVCEVRFQEWTGDGVIRQGAYLGLRPDKKPADVIREREKTTKTVVRKAGREVQSARHAASQAVYASMKPLPEKTGLPVSNPTKVFFPQAGYTKLDLAGYYQSVAPYILPYLKDRPMVLNRFPNGIEGKSFYQKDQTGPLPEWMESTLVWSDSNGKELRYLLCNSQDALLYLVNLGCIDMNPWNSRVQHLENPDWMVIDLDPEGIGFDKVIETAQVVHEVLDGLGAANYCKTSGKTGLHIYVPMGARYGYDTVKDFGHLVSALVHQETSRWTSLERSPGKRQGKVYLDYLQNRFAQTLAAPYSVRPVAEASVSTPLSWEEVRKGLAPARFTMANTASRLSELGDIWTPVLGEGIDLERCLRNLDERGRIS